MSGLLSSLQQLKNTLASLEVAYEDEKEYVIYASKREDVQIRIENKLENLLKKNDKSNTVFLNAAGKIFRTTKETILNCRYKNILQDKLNSTSQGTSEENSIYVNIPKNYFVHILNVMRRLNDAELSEIGSFNDYYLKGNSIKLKIDLLRVEETKDNLQEYITGFFLGEKKVLKELKIMNKGKVVKESETVKKKKK